MSAEYLVDSDWLVYHLRGRRPDISERLKSLAGSLAVSIVSLAELYTGIYRSTKQAEDRAGLDRFLEGIPVLGVDRETAEVFGREDARLRVAHTPLDGFDLLIAATALRHGRTLLTNNRRHFERVAGLTIESS